MISVGMFLWAIGLAVFEVLPISSSYLLLSAQMLYLSASLIPLFFYVFSLAFTAGRIKITKASSIFIAASYTLIIVLIATPGMLIQGVYGGVDAAKMIKFGPLYLLFLLHIIGYFVSGFVVLFKQYIRGTGLVRLQLKYILIGASIPALVGTTTNLVLPFFGFFHFFWLGPTMTIAVVLFIGYATARYNLWDFKLILTQVFISLLWAFILIRTILSNTARDQITNAGLLIVVVILGLLIIRNVNQRNRIA